MSVEVEAELDEVILNRRELLKAAIRHLDSEGIIDLDDMTKYTFQWCLLDDGLGLKISRT